jgi:hypothetical protein
MPQNYDGTTLYAIYHRIYTGTFSRDPISVKSINDETNTNPIELSCSVWNKGSNGK